MKPITLAVIRDFFLFRAAAIRTVANNPSALWIGLLLVLGAGFAREYDQEFLLAEPWYLLAPLAASVLGILLLTCLIPAVAFFKLPKPVSWWRQLRSIAAVYWMTAPLAWLYAVPVEYWMEPVGAVRFNLSALALVAIYRVALMTRGVQVLYQYSWGSSFVIVMLFSDLVTLAALYFMPRPIYLVMGGIRLSPSESLIQTIHMLLSFLCVVSLPVWLIGVVVSAFESKKGAEEFGTTQLENSSEVKGQRTPPFGRGVLFLVAAQLLLGLVLTVLFLPTQSLRWKLERGLETQDYAAVARLSREHSRPEFPPHLDLPPRISYGAESSDLYKTVNGLRRHEAADWLLDLYLDQLLKEVDGRSDSISASYAYEPIDNQGLIEYLEVIRNSQDPRSLVEPQLDSLRYLVEVEEDEVRKRLLEQLIEAGGFAVEEETGDPMQSPVPGS